MTLITRDIRNNLKILPDGSSSDYISPSFGLGCLYNCTYMSAKRNKPTGLSLANITNQILTEINNHVIFEKSKIIKPNSAHDKYIVYDIGHYEDFAFHLEHHEWKRIFNFFKNHNDIMASFSTRYVNEKLLDYKPDQKIRITFNLMPESKRIIHEPETSTILERIQSLEKFIKADYDVRINYSPIIIYDGWLDDYEELFALINDHVISEKSLHAGCEFLTHNNRRHHHNLLNNFDAETELWVPELQEEDYEEYDKNNIVYRTEYKRQWMEDFVKCHKNSIPWNKIKYFK